MGAHDAADAYRPSAAPRRRGQSFTQIVLIAAAAITWLFAVICVIGVIADGDSDARLGFVILGVPFLAAALACTYAARGMGPREQAGRGPTRRADPPPDEPGLGALPGETGLSLTTMRREYAELDAKLADGERTTEAWQTMTQIERTIVPDTVRAYRRVAGSAAADADFLRAVRLLSNTFADRRAVLTATMLDGLHNETHYIEDRFAPSELTVDDPPDGPHPAR